MLENKENHDLTVFYYIVNRLKINNRIINVYKLNRLKLVLLDLLMTSILLTLISIDIVVNSYIYWWPNSSISFPGIAPAIFNNFISIPIALTSSVFPNNPKMSLLASYWLMYIFSIPLSIYLSRKFIEFMVPTVNSKVKVIGSQLAVIIFLFLPYNANSILSFEGVQVGAYSLQIFIIYSILLSSILFVSTAKKSYFAIFAIMLLVCSFQFAYLSEFIFLLILIVYTLVRKGTLSRFIPVAVEIFLFLLIIGSKSIFLQSSPAFGQYSMPYLPGIPFGYPTNPAGKSYLLFSYSNPYTALFLQFFFGGPFYYKPFNFYSYSIVLAIFFACGILGIFLRFKDKLGKNLFFFFIAYIAIDLFTFKFAAGFSALMPTNLLYYNLISTITNNPAYLMILTQFLFIIIFLLAFTILTSSINKIRNSLSVIIERIGFNGITKALNKKKLATAFSLVVIIILLAPYIVQVTSLANDQSYSTSVKVDSFLVGLGEPMTYFYFPGKVNCSQFMVVTNYANNQVEVSKDKALSTYYALGNNVFTPGFLGKKNLSPSILSYLLSLFGYKLIVISDFDLSLILGDSGYFQILRNINGFYILRINSPPIDNKTILLTTSVTTLENFITIKHIFPIWDYSYAVMNNTELLLHAALKENVTVYISNYTTLFSFYTFINPKTVMIPTEYSRNTDGYSGWAIGYFNDYPQETWSNIAIGLTNYQFQNDPHSLYGLVYTTDNNSSLKLDTSIEPGKYVVISRILHSNEGGSLSFQLNGAIKTVSTKSNFSYFSFNLITNVTVNTSSLNIILKNNYGLNAINVIYLIPVNTYNFYAPKLIQAFSSPNVVTLPWEYYIAG